jgi:CubicO group peptidase (beta-lactamase class C family)
MAAETFTQADQRLLGFDDFVRSTMQAWKVPGLAIGIVRDDALLFLKGFGHRDTDRNLAVTPQTLFALASGTKAFTTMALALLVDEGKLDWDTPVRQYLPSFKLHDSFATERITPRDLVTHRSGLPRHDLAWYNSPHSREELVRRLQYLEPNTDFRTVWQYQNLMYMTAGYLIEHLARQTWEAFVQQRIFQPLAMHGSNFSVEVSEAFDDHALPYKEQNGQLTRMPFYRQFAVGPAGSINTNVADMAKWLRLHLGKGAYQGNRLISEAQIRDMHSPQMVIQKPAKYAELPHVSYGLGWFVEPYRGYDFIHHGGNIDGFSTMTTLMPQENLGVVVLCNLNGSPAPWLICLNAYERLLELEQTAWTERFKQDEAEQKAGEERGKAKSSEDRVLDTQPSHPLESYVGDYEHSGYGIVSFTLADGALQAIFNGTTLPLTHYHYDTFELTWEQWDLRIKLTFSANVRGDIDSLAVPLEQTVRDIIFTRIPDRAMSEPSFLAQFVGDYSLFGMPMSIALRGDSTLLARLPGQPDIQLIPRKGTEFLARDLSGYSIEFVRDASGAVTEAVVTQPLGVFTAKKQ